MTRPLATMFAALFALAVAPTGATPAPVPPPLKVDANTVFAHLTGTWERVSLTWRGEETTFPVGKRGVVTFAKDGSWRSADGNRSGKTTFIDPTKAPKELDWELSYGGYTERRKMIFSLDADTFITCSSARDTRPTAFESTRENDGMVSVYKRVKE